jgi:uncharacterized protein
MSKDLNRKQLLKASAAAGAMLVAGDLMSRGTKIPQGAVKIRQKKILHIVFACVLSIVLVACTTPPPVRKIPPEWIQDVQRKQNLKNIRWVAEDRINRTLSLLDGLGDKINDSHRRDIVEIDIEELRQTLKGDNVDEISDKLGLLHASAGTLINADQEIQFATTFLSDFGDKLSPSLVDQIRTAIEQLKQAIRGTDWEEIYKNYDALRDWREYRFGVVKSYQMIPDNIAKLGNKLGPSLRNQVLLKIKPFQQAMKGDSWDALGDSYGQLPRFVSYPIQVVYKRDWGIRMLEESLGPSEKQVMISALEALDVAMRGDDWEDVLAKADQIEEIRAKFGIDAGLTGWSPSCVRVLSIDGGGVRGIIPAIILAEIEKRTKKPIAELFDVIAGTSTGGILALGLTKPDPKDPSKPAYRAADLVKLYEKEGEKIFPQTPLLTVRQLWGPKYSHQGIEDVLKNYFGDTYFSDALTNVVIPTYAIELRRHVFFSTYTMPISPFYMWEVARSASAAPTYFPPFRVPGSKEKDKEYTALIDGGVFANNPSTHAIAYAKEYECGDPHYPGDYTHRGKPYDANHPLLLLSLGTGRVPSSTSFDDAWNWGLPKWGGPLIDILFSDPAVEDETRQLLKFGDYYFRLQPEKLTVSASKLDNASKTNLQELERIAQRYIEENNSQIEKLAKYLLRERPTECTPSVARPF